MTTTREREHEFFSLAIERQQIYLRRREGRPPPWTDDPVFRQYRFCNVFREQDKTTAWVRKYVRGPLADRPADVLLATIAFRWFNRIETGERLLPLLLGGWDTREASRLLTGVAPIVTGAYMIKSPAGMTKLAGLLWCIEQVEPHIEMLAAAIADNESIEWATGALAEYPYLGTFMAYEVATDLRHTCLLRGARDVMSWASPGPGACRGISRILTGRPELYNYGSATSRAQVLDHMRRLLELSQSQRMWEQEDKANWPAWEMRDVEHWSCEFDKYERVRTGEGRPKQLFKSGG